MDSSAPANFSFSSFFSLLFYFASRVSKKKISPQSQDHIDLFSLLAHWRWLWFCEMPGIKSHDYSHYTDRLNTSSFLRIKWHLNLATVSLQVLCNFPDLRLHYIYFTHTLYLSSVFVMNQSCQVQLYYLDTNKSISWVHVTHYSHFWFNVQESKKGKYTSIEEDRTLNGAITSLGDFERRAHLTQNLRFFPNYKAHNVSLNRTFFLYIPFFQYNVNNPWKLAI